MTIQRCLISIVVAAALLAAQPKQTPAAALGAARHLEEAEGNYPAAIEAYKKIVAQAGKDRALAAQALVRMGQCYEKLGDLEARKTYERIIREFAGEKDAVTTARARLAGLSGRQADTGLVAQQVGPNLGDKAYGRAISSDGRYVAFEEHGQISVQDLRTLEAHAVIGVFNSSKEKLYGPIISPDGKQLACFRQPAEGPEDLYVVGTDGSNARPIAKSVVDLFGWTPDGKRLLVRVRGDVGRPQDVLLSVSDGSRQPIPGLPSPIIDARISPDGRHVAFLKRANAGAPPGIYTLPIEGGTPVLLVENAAVTLRWTPDGNQMLFYRDLQGTSALWSIPVTNGAPAGPARVVKDNISGVLDVTAAGDIYYRVRIMTNDVYVAGVDTQSTRLTSQPTPLTSGGMATGGAAWSPDGQYLAYYTLGGIVIRSVRTGEERKLNPKDPLNATRRFWPGSLQVLWSADSKSLFGTGGGVVGLVDIQTGEVKRLWDDDSRLPVYRDGEATGPYNPSVALAPDGRTIYQLERDPAAQQTKVMRVDLQTKARSEIYRMDADIVRGFAISRDGSRLLMTRVRTVPGGPPKGTATIVILPTGGGGATEMAMPPKMSNPSWSSDGRRLLFARGQSTGEFYSMPVEGGSPQLMGTGIGLSDPSFLGASPDGIQIVFTDGTWSNHLWVLKNAINITTAAR